MKYIGSVKMGCLHDGNIAYPPPSKPYNSDSEMFLNSGLGDIYSNSDAKYAWDIIDTSDESKMITWHKFEISDKMIYICDRVLIKDMSKDELMNFITNNNIFFGDKKFNLRIIYKSEWDSLVQNCECVGIPINTIKDTMNKLTKDKLNSNHNIFWNWIGMGSYVLSNNEILTKGYYYPNYENVAVYSSNEVGFRPVLEEYIAHPVVECETGRLGEKVEPFNYDYRVTSYIDNDNVLIREKFNDRIIREYTVSEGIVASSINMSKYWSASMYGVQHIEIQATNKNGEVTTKKATFSTELPTFVDKLGLKYFAQQLWNAKIKPFVEEFSKKQGGLILDSKWKFTGGGTVFDTAYADNGSAIRYGISSTAANIARFNTSDLKLGRHGVMVRASLSDGGHTNNVFVVNIYKKNPSGTRTLIATRNFKANEFTGGSNSFKCAYFVFEYQGAKAKGETIEVDVDSVSGTSSNTFMLDYILVSQVLPAVYN